MIVWITHAKVGHRQANPQNAFLDISLMYQGVLLCIEVFPAAFAGMQEW
jgi:hypothetical protein